MELTGDPLFRGMAYAGLMLRQLCIVATLGFVVFRLPALRRAVASGGSHPWERLLLIALFSLVAIIDDRTGVAIDTHTGRIVERSAELGPGEAIIDLRDMIATVAGLCGGVWIGLGVGLVAGIHRYSLGSFVAPAAGSATAVLGFLAGCLHWRFRGLVTNPLRTAAIGVAATLIQRVFILLLATPLGDAWQLTLIIFAPKLATNVVGCALFALIMRTVESDRQALSAQQALAKAAAADAARLALQAERDRETLLRQEAEIRALQAQVEPHFLLNTLNAIKALIRVDPDRARDYVVKLGEFFRETHNFAELDRVPLRQELAHVRRYLDFQMLRFQSALVYDEEVDPGAMDCPIPPQTLMTLVENALTHGRRRDIVPFRLTLRVETRDGAVLIRLTDNGVGIPPQRLELLGTAAVPSERGTGTALHRLSRILHGACGPAARLEISNRTEGGVCACLRLPVGRCS